MESSRQGSVTWKGRGSPGQGRDVSGQLGRAVDGPAQPRGDGTRLLRELSSAQLLLPSGCPHSRPVPCSPTFPHPCPECRSTEGSRDQANSQEQPAQNSAGVSFPGRSQTHLATSLSNCSRDWMSSRVPSNLIHPVQEFSLFPGHIFHLQSSLSGPLLTQGSQGSLPHPSQGCPHLHHPRDTRAASPASLHPPQVLSLQLPGQDPTPEPWCLPPLTHHHSTSSPPQPTREFVPSRM